MLSRLPLLLIVTGLITTPLLAQQAVEPAVEPALTGVSPAPAWPETARFVTDDLRVGAREGPSLKFPVRVMLPAGAQVDTLAERDGYSQVRLQDGQALWISTRHLLSEPPARVRIGGVRDALAQAGARIAELEAKIATLADANASAAAERERVSNSEAAMAEELASIRKAASSTLEIRRRNEELGEQVLGLERKLGDAAQREAIMASAREREWLIAGAGVLAVGVILGLLLPHLRLRRQRSSWGEL